MLRDVSQPSPWRVGTAGGWQRPLPEPFVLRRRPLPLVVAGRTVVLPWRAGQWCRRPGRSLTGRAAASCLGWRASGEGSPTTPLGEQARVTGLQASGAWGGVHCPAAAESWRG